ncbi:CGNR zinc finger domain-containing protein [Actinoplanes sp. NPDC020271]|uniref:CGNR zinc finger domain-containing protein n=1 Tax=Actinoplanes sp. NPDC020271 TaxID=3363896 RepID=UPI0037915DA8
MTTLVRPLLPEEVVALVNDWGTSPRRVGARPEDPQSTSSYPRTDPATAIAVADRVHVVFAATEPAEQARLVTAMLDEAAPRPVMTVAGGEAIAAWSVAGPGDQLLAAASLALREHLTDHPHRLGVCADHQCADVYVDASPAGRRRFCSLTCQNRARAAAFRERRRAASDAPGTVSGGQQEAR